MLLIDRCKYIAVIRSPVLTGSWTLDLSAASLMRKTTLIMCRSYNGKSKKKGIYLTLKQSSICNSRLRDPFRIDNTTHSSSEEENTTRKKGQLTACIWRRSTVTQVILWESLVKPTQSTSLTEASEHGRRLWRSQPGTSFRCTRWLHYQEFDVFVKLAAYFDNLLVTSS